MKTLVVIRQMRDCAPVVSFVQAMPQQLLVPEVHTQLLNYATELARIHVQQFVKKFHEFAPQNCAWYVHLVDDSDPTSDTSCRSELLSIASDR